MRPTRILTRADLEQLVTMELAIEAVEEAFAAHGRGQARMPAKVYLPLPEYAGDFRAMPAYLGDAAGVKWVNAHPQNPERHGLPAVMGVYILSDPETALPIAILDGTVLTAYRTGAAAGVATRHLARSETSTLGLIGCGVQAGYLWEAHQVVRPGLQVVCADRSAAAAEALAARTGGRVGSIEEAAGCDIVCTQTPVRDPIVADTAIRSGAHVNAMGADAPGKQELEEAILLRARVFVDDAHQAFSSGEVNVPLQRGALTERDIVGTLGEVVAGTRPGRQSEAQITVFDSTGLAIQDLALARRVVEVAIERGIGLLVPLVG